MRQYRVHKSNSFPHSLRMIFKKTFPQCLSAVLWVGAVRSSIDWNIRDYYLREASQNWGWWEVMQFEGFCFSRAASCPSIPMKSSTSASPTHPEPDWPSGVAASVGRGPSSSRTGAGLGGCLRSAGSPGPGPGPGLTVCGAGPHPDLHFPGPAWKSV